MEFKHIYRDVQFVFIDFELSPYWLLQAQILDKINELNSTLKHIDLGYCFFQRKICGQLFNIG